jgi:hypothetical protein
MAITKLISDSATTSGFEYQKFVNVTGVNFTRSQAGAALISAMICVPTPQSVSAAEIVQNGSFEMLSASFVDDGSNYMSLDHGSTTITGWTVSTSTGAIVLGRSPTGDGLSAADGSFFVDLSGFGSSSPDGALNQIVHTVAGATYTFSMDIGGANNGIVSALVGGKSLTLTSGTPFVVDGTEWVPETAMFVGASLNINPLVTIQNESPGSDIDLIDTVSIVGPATSVPELSTWSMMLVGFAGLGYAGYRRAREPRAA